MLVVYLDKYGVKETGIVIEKVEEYVDRWEEVLDALRRNARLEIRISNPFFKGWFKHLKEVFKEEIVIEEIIPRKIWEEEYSVKLPEEVTDRAITTLIKNEKEISSEIDFEIGTLFLLCGEDASSSQNLSQGLTRIILDGAESKYPELLGKALAKHKEEQPPKERHFWLTLLESKNKLQVLLEMVMSKMLASYPSELEIVERYKKSSLAFQNIPLPEEIDRYLPSDFKNSLKGSVEALIQKEGIKTYRYISGISRKEIEPFVEFIRDNPIQRKEDIDELLQRSLAYTDLYNQIKDYLPVPSPSLGISSETFRQWIKEYASYYLYSRRIGKEGLTTPFVKEFEGWLFDNLEKVYNSDDSIFFIKQMIEEALQEGRRVLFLIVDGLGYIFYQELQNLLDEEVSPKICKLPSTTEPNKTALLTGLQIEDEIDYKIADDISQYWPHLTKIEMSSSSQASLLELLKKEADLYVYFENDFDVLTHQRKSFEKRWQDQVEILKRLKEETSNFVREGGVVILTGDHGYTIIPRSKDNKITFLEGECSHGRILRWDGKIGEKRLSPVQDRGMTFWLASEYCYLNSLPQGGAHGGASPEEVVVPLAVIKGKVVIEPLELSVEPQPLRRGSVAEAKLRAYNPNKFLATITKLDLGPLVKLKEPSRIYISPQQKRVVLMEIDLREVKTFEVVLPCSLSIKAGDATKEFINELTLETKGAMIATEEDQWDI